MFIGFTEKQLSTLAPEFQEVIDSFESVQSYLAPFRDSGVTIELAPAVIIAYSGFVKEIQFIFKDLTSGKVVDMEARATLLQEWVYHLEEVCSTEIIVK